MKLWALLLGAVMVLGTPVFGHAQPSDDESNPDQYQDVDDGQILQLAAYALTPIGMGLEWGLMRPLHYLATQTAIGPLLKGDKDKVGFGETNNADLVPPGTFDPAPMNLTNTFVSSPLEAIKEESLQESKIPPEPSRQPTIH